MNNRNNRTQWSATGNEKSIGKDNVHDNGLELDVFKPSEQSATSNDEPLGQDEEHGHGLQNPSPTDGQRNSKTQPVRSKPLDLKDYQPFLHEDITASDALKEGLECSCTNYWRLAIPGILVFLSVMILGLSYLSYDLHPLACLRQPEEEFIKYNATTKRVELEFSDGLTYFQKVAALIVFVMVVLYALLAYWFYVLSERITKSLKSKAGDHIDKKERSIQELSCT